MKRVVVIGLVLLFVTVAVAGWFLTRKPTPATTPSSTATEQPTTARAPAPEQPAATTPAEPAAPAFALPIAQYKERVTKKHFGDYSTPATSPIQPERFTGYHTGSDAEYTDTEADVPVYAIVDATVVQASWVSGYGGLLVLKGNINGKTNFILYGHVRQSSLPSVGSTVKKGDQIGVLGTGFSHETDNERKHLHFAIYTGPKLDIRGYVQNKSELSNWLDPLTLY